MWKHIAANGLTFLIVALFLAGGVILWGMNEYSAEGPLDQAICLNVRDGSNMRRVSEQLSEQGAIKSPAIFRMGSDYSERTSQLKAGNFLVPERASMEDIVGIVTGTGRSTCGTEVVYRIGVVRNVVQIRELDPATNRYVDLAEFEMAGDNVPAVYGTVRDESDTQYRVVLAEGVTSWQAMTALNGIDVLTGEIGETPAEGALAPDSYELVPGEDVAQILDEMVTAQAEFLAQAWANRVDGLPLETPEQALILASIVEKETGGQDEVGTVASVFENRLRQGMPLQTDPTVIYGITNGEGILGRGLRQSELRAETPYNTYVIPGLPPTPIANPGRASIEAVMNPEETDYIFFVAKTLNPADGHNFAVTLEEHNANVAIYRALEAAAAE
ncbi:endolytic transglycosylase MltG [Octadecabacter sp. SW4]|uniref:endolytic transglycosylase MltG n=1 Tax=Octadecabacter sp. SW4 TaxID=2602067 RepID=UPI0011C1EF42|nr:endolytic transglycosylase MltG [Octadecabacter sp. SW4]QEE35896.1 endolytic transglycosylase MltG [Octadecabacter sp. SW4]